MTLIRAFSIATRTQDETVAVVNDLTNYGAPEILRSAEAHFMVIAKMDENQVLTLLTGVDNSAPTSALSYTFTQGLDGAYRFICFIPPAWSGATAYVAETRDSNSPSNLLTFASIVWHASDSKFYKCILANTNIEPNVTTNWANYWKVITDFSAEIAPIGVNQTILVNNICPTFITDDIVTFRYEDCLRDEIEEVSDDILINNASSWQELFQPVAMQLMLAAANSLNWESKAPRADLVVQQATKKFCC